MKRLPALLIAIALIGPLAIAQTKASASEKEAIKTIAITAAYSGGREAN